MSKAIAVLGSALFFAIAPLVLAGFVPWWVTQWEFRSAFFGVDLTRILGGILIIVGVPRFVDSFARFALEGLGTPAPIAPTQKLVVTGLYRYLRNPIYIAVAAFERIDACLLMIGKLDTQQPRVLAQLHGAEEPIRGSSGGRSIHLPVSP
jgi:hypothetical protein